MGLKNNKNIPADVRRTIVEELGHHTRVCVVHPYCFGNLLPLRLDRSCNGNAKMHHVRQKPHDSLPMT